MEEQEKDKAVVENMAAAHGLSSLKQTEVNSYTFLRR